jgi:hypothetical protein
MNAKQVLFTSVIALATTGALAEVSIYDGATRLAPSQVSRSEVQNQVLAARASGQLRFAGELDRRNLVEPAVASTRSRSDVNADVIAARNAGELIPPGEKYDPSAQPVASTRGPLKASIQTGARRQSGG